MTNLRKKKAKLKKSFTRGGRGEIRGRPNRFPKLSLVPIPPLSGVIAAARHRVTRALPVSPCTRRAPSRQAAQLGQTCAIVRPQAVLARPALDFSFCQIISPLPWLCHDFSLGA